VISLQLSFVKQSYIPAPGGAKASREGKSVEPHRLLGSSTLRSRWPARPRLRRRHGYYAQHRDGDVSEHRDPAATGTATSSLPSVANQGGELKRGDLAPSGGETVHTQGLETSFDRSSASNRTFFCQYTLRHKAVIATSEPRSPRFSFFSP
jgi:hypothetical protein